MVTTNSLDTPLLADHSQTHTTSDRDSGCHNEIKAVLTLLHQNHCHLQPKTREEVATVVNQYERQMQSLLTTASTIVEPELRLNSTQQIYLAFSRLLLATLSIYALPTAIELIQNRHLLEQLYLNLSQQYHSEYNLEQHPSIGYMPPGLDSTTTSTMPLAINYQYCICFLCCYQKLEGSADKATFSARWLAEQIQLGKEPLPASIQDLATAGLKDQAFLWLAQVFYELSLECSQQFMASWLSYPRARQHLANAAFILDNYVTDSALATAQGELRTNIQALATLLKKHDQNRWSWWTPRQPQPQTKATQRTSLAPSLTYS